MNYNTEEYKKSNDRLKKCLREAMSVVNYVGKESCNILQHLEDDTDVDIFNTVYKINQRVHESKKKVDTYCPDLD